MVLLISMPSIYITGHQHVIRAEHLSKKFGSRIHMDISGLITRLITHVGRAYRGRTRSPREGYKDYQVGYAGNSEPLGTTQGVLCTYWLVVFHWTPHVRLWLLICQMLSSGAWQYLFALYSDKWENHVIMDPQDVVGTGSLFMRESPAGTAIAKYLLIQLWGDIRTSGTGTKWYSGILAVWAMPCDSYPAWENLFLLQLRLWGTAKVVDCISRGSAKSGGIVKGQFVWVWTKSPHHRQKVLDCKLWWHCQRTICVGLD